MNQTKDIFTRKREVAEREKRKASFHEAGHAAICSRLGGYGTAMVWRNTAQRIKTGERAWLGTFKMYFKPGTVNMDRKTKLALGVIPITKNWRVLLGMAGLVAENIADGITDADEIAGIIFDAIMVDEVSQTDKDLMGIHWRVRDVAKVVKLLQDKWPEVERVAASLTA
ncbi:MAG: hypothetical protein Q7J38_05545 [Gallionella sp.]|nr:hypothetical protein [Gallionella sp.]